MNHNQRGFTLIELMLSMSFIAVLLIAVAMTTIQISNIYNKGITLREVNQVGRALTEDLQRSISTTSPFDVTPNTTTSRYVERPGGGRLCLGQYTYAWNYGKAFDGEVPVYNQYSDFGNAPVRFAKVPDSNGGLCSVPDAKIPRTNAVEMLTTGDRDLVAHNFSIQQTATDPATSQAIYSIILLIGTNDRQQLTANDASCKPPSEGVGNEDYCAVNQFEIIARAGNKAGGK